jgi:hypothetical protein
MVQVIQYILFLSVKALALSSMIQVGIIAYISGLMHIRKYTQITHIRHATYIPLYVFLQVIAITEIWIAAFTGDLILILSMNRPRYCEAA